MKVVEDLIKKMLELQEEFSLRGFIIRGVWMFYKCYNISINVLGIPDKNTRTRQELWRRYIYSHINKDDFKISRCEAKFQELICSDMIKVTDALSTLSIEIDKQGMNKSSLWKKGVVGFADFELKAQAGKYGT